MSKKLAILVVHGMGETPLDEDEGSPKFPLGLKRRLKKSLGSDWDNIDFMPVYWQPVLQPQQSALWDKMQESNRLRYKRAREFFLYGFADAGALEYSRSLRNGAYEKVQKIIFRAFKQALKKLDQPNRPVIVIAQSLGCQIMSNYFYDASKRDGKRRGMWKDGEPFGIGQKPTASELDFMQGKTIRCFLTTGCNIPLFVAGLETISPIDKPNPSFQWKNFYDADDILGFPLKQLSPGYDDLVEDIPINAGSPWMSWTPLSHTEYWTDRDFYEPLTNMVLDTLATLG